MWRKVLGLLWVGALAACTQPLRFCEQDSDCQQTQAGASCQQNVCVYDGETSSTACTPVCADYQVCLAKTLECAPRFSGVEVTPKSDTTVGGGEVFVRAELLLAGNFESKFPATLRLSVKPSSGTASELTMQQEEAGTGKYLARWTPSGEGNYQLTVSYPEAQVSSAPVTLKVDTTGPVLTVSLPARSDGGTPDSGFIYADPSAPGAWRRDEKVAVRVESSATDVEPRSLSVRVNGFDGGASLENLTLTQVPCDAGYCGTVDVPLWTPGLPAFRGAFAVEVSAKDSVGNAGMGAGSIPVTRWKWSFNGASGAIRSSPAIGKLGTVYFGTNDSTGKVFALSPDGVEQWRAQLGAVQGGVSLGAYTTEYDPVFVAANGSEGGVLYALGAKGVVTSRCPKSGGVSAINTAVAVLSTKYGAEQNAVETAVALAGEEALISLRPSAVLSSRQCVTSPPVSASASTGDAMIAKGADVYFGSPSDTSVLSYRFSDNGWVTKPGFTAPVIGSTTSGLGFSSDARIIGAAGSTGPSAGGIFSFADADGSGLKKYPASFTGKPPVRNTSVGLNNVTFFGQEVVGGELAAVDLLTGNARATAPAVGSVVGAPVLGSLGLVYTSSASGLSTGVGEVAVWRADNLSSVWKLSDTVGRSVASPTLDCARDSLGNASGNPHGVLYVPSTDGKLYAFVVDSAGLDRTAPWPKYQHDSRNTGNPETPITSCP